MTIQVFLQKAWTKRAVHMPIPMCQALQVILVVYKMGQLGIHLLHKLKPLQTSGFINLIWHLEVHVRARGQELFMVIGSCLYLTAAPIMTAPVLEGNFNFP